MCRRRISLHQSTWVTGHPSQGDQFMMDLELAHNWFKVFKNQWPSTVLLSGEPKWLKEGSDAYTELLECEVSACSATCV